MDLETIIDWYKPVEAAMAKAGLANEFSVYERLLDFLASDPRFDVRPLADLLVPLDRDRVRVCLRHDVDSLLPPARRAGEALLCRKLVGSFYFLHTAMYYGYFIKGAFVRNPAVVEFIDDFMDLKQEIGLHIDPLSVYFCFGINGAQSVLDELSWMRSRGVRVNGVLAHNSAPVFGAENFEIFLGLALDDRRHVIYKGIKAPLQTITMGEAGLTYEGNFPSAPYLHDKHWLSAYLAHIPTDALRRSDWLSVYLQHNPVFSRANDVSVWLLGKDAWAIAECKPRARFFFNIGHEDVLDYLKTYKYSGRIVIVIHPEYLSGGDFSL